MKIVLLRQEKPIAHVVEERHIEKIQKIDSSIELMVPLANAFEQVKHAMQNAHVAAGFPGDLAKLSLADMPEMQWIHSFSAGVEKILTPEIKTSDIMVSNSSGVHAIPIAEHVLGFILLHAKRFPQSLKNQAQKQWEPLEEITEIRSRTVLVVGLGRIGTEIAKVCAGVGMRVIAADTVAKEQPEYIHTLYTAGRLPEALSQADYVVFALPYTKETHHLFGVEKFRAMKRSSVIINIARGAVIHEQELIAALQEKIIAGAALDVTEQEPLQQESPLWEMENVVITPHHSSRTKERMDRTIDLFRDNIRAYMHGDALPTLVNKQRGY
jgi:D-2-hydroxyacid dehydrogenase (NADP+)